MIAEQLANKRIAITGSTGFVGTALVERLLHSVPDCTLVLLVLNVGSRGAAAQTRAAPERANPSRSLRGDRRRRQYRRARTQRRRPCDLRELRHRHSLGRGCVV